MAKASELLTLECAYFVGQQRPLESLAWWKQAVIRAAFWLTGWCGGVEGQSICTDEGLAKQMIGKKANWFAQILPVNVPLPDEPVQFKGHSFPASDSPDRYTNLNLALVAVPKKKITSELEQVRQLEAKVNELGECLEGKCVGPA